jgi:adenosylcobinamide-GDP ribazoletransferase
MAPVLARGSLVALSATLPYARPGAAQNASNFAGRAELAISTTIALAITLAVARWRGLAIFAIVTTAAALWGWYCVRRIQGITGDTLGAGIEVAECFVLLAGVVA